MKQPRVNNVAILSAMDKVEEFIKRRFGDTDAHWHDGNCYWFAQILVARFPHLTIYYEPVDGHFYAGTGTIFYDARGRHESYTLPHLPMLLKYIQYDDPIWYQRIVRDCIK